MEGKIVKEELINSIIAELQDQKINFLEFMLNFIKAMKKRENMV